MSHRYGIFSWWWAHSCPKHVEKSDKHIKKICAPGWFYLREYTSRCILSSPINSHHSAEQLHVRLPWPFPLFGCNTTDILQSGIVALKLFHALFQSQKLKFPSKHLYVTTVIGKRFGLHIEITRHVALSQYFRRMSFQVSEPSLSCLVTSFGTAVDCVWNVMAHAQKPDFVFRRKGRVYLNFRRRIKSRLPFAGIIRRLPYSTRFQDKG